MKELLQLIEYQRDKGLPIVNHYRPGIAEAQVSRLEQQAGISAPPQLVDLYKCRNGAMGSDLTPMGELWLLPPYFWLSFEEALATRTELLQDDAAGVWTHAIPVFSSGSGAWIKVGLLSGDVWMLDEELAHTSLIAKSISDFFLIILNGWQSGLIFIDTDGLPNVSPDFWPKV